MSNFFRSQILKDLLENLVFTRNGALINIKVNHKNQLSYNKNKNNHCFQKQLFRGGIWAVDLKNNLNDKMEGTF